MQTKPRFVQVYEYNIHQMYIEEKPLVLEYHFTEKDVPEDFISNLGGLQENIVDRDVLVYLHDANTNLNSFVAFLENILDNSDSEQFQIVFA